MDQSRALLHASVIPQSYSWNCGFIALAFATRFDPQEGNVIEYVYPNNINKERLDGLEFLTLPAGSHIIEQDYILFRCAGLWGISVFNQLADTPQGYKLISFILHSYIIFHFC